MKLVDKETLLQEKEAKKAEEAKRAAEKAEKQAKLAAAQALKDAQRKIPPSELFKSETDKYSQFDETVSIHNSSHSWLNNLVIMLLMYFHLSGCIKTYSLTLRLL